METLGNKQPMLDAKEVEQNNWWVIPFAEVLGQFYREPLYFLVLDCVNTYRDAEGDADAKRKALLQFCVSRLDEHYQAGRITDEEKSSLLKKKSPRSAETIADVISAMRNPSVALMQSVVREPVYAAEKQPTLESNTLTPHYTKK